MTRTVNLGCQTGQALFNTAIKKKKKKRESTFQNRFQTNVHVNQKTKQTKKAK